MGSSDVRPLVGRGRDEVPLDVRSVTKRFRRRRSSAFRWHGRNDPAEFHTAVDRVSFTVGPAEIYGVIGANGSGKSTLIRMVSTLLLPDEGTVLVHGYDAVREPLKVRALLNRVSADPSFFRAMSPMENLLFFGRAYGLGARAVRERCLEIFARLHLEPDRLGEPMMRLSRGQQQKVAVARAFLTSPRVLLLDEPTTGLDPRSKRDVQRFVTELREEEHVSILLTTHDMQEAEQLCNTVAFLAAGRIVAEGTPLELRQRVASERLVAEVDMDEVFMELTGHTVEDDEEHDVADT